MDLNHLPTSPGAQMQPVAYLPGTGIAQPPVPDVVDLREYIRIILKRRWIIVMTTLGIFSAAALFVFSMPRVYRATARVRVTQLQPLVTLTPMAAPAPQISLNTEVKSIQSSDMADKTAERLQTEHGLKLTPGEILTSLSVAIEEPDVLAISAEATDQERAVLLANAVQATYIAENTAVARAEATGSRNFLEAQMDVVKRELQRIEDDIIRCKTANNIRDEDPASALRAGLAPDYTIQAQAELQAAMAQFSSLRTRLASQRPTRRILRLANDPVSEGLRQAMTETEVDLNRALAQYEETHPQVVALRNKLKGLRSQMQARAAGKQMVEEEEPNPLYQALEERVQEMETEIEALKVRASMAAAMAAKMSAQSPASQGGGVELTRLKNAREIAQKTYAALLEQLQQVRLKEASQQGTARRLDKATRPSRPVRPTPGRTLALAAIVGLLTGLSLALLREYTDTSVNDPEQLMHRTGITSLGFIPAAHTSLADPKVTVLLPKSHLAEGFRMVHANLKFASLDSPLRTIMVTSAAAGEGKSFTAVNLAIVYAQAGISTLLVDGDLRRPTMHRAFGLEHTPGLTNVLAGEVRLEDVIRETDMECLKVLVAGSIPPNPTALLDSHRMGILIEELKEHAEVVIFDSPPALAVADALILSPRVDAVALVVEQGKVNSRALSEIRRIIEQARGNIAGAIINKVKRGAGDYYYYYYHYYYYYSSDENGKRAGNRKRRGFSLLGAGRTPTALPSGEPNTDESQHGAET